MANAISTILALLIPIVFIAGILGLIKPSIIRQDSRAKAFGKSMGFCFVLLVALIFAIPEDASKGDDSTTKGDAIIEVEPSVDEVELNSEADLPKDKEVLNITFDINHKVDANGLLSFEATTSAPDGVKLSISLKDNDGNSLGSSKAIVKDYSFKSENFSQGGNPHLAGDYILRVSEWGKGSLTPDSEKMFLPFNYKFTLEPSNATPNALTDEQKIETLKFFTQIITTIKDKRQEVQDVRNTQPMGRGQSGSIFLANWNSQVQQWEEELTTNRIDVLGTGMTAPYCSTAAFNTSLAMAELKQLGIGYVFGDAKVQESNLAESIANAEKEITVCLKQLPNTQQIDEPSEAKSTQKEMTVSRKNIEAVIYSLKNNYDIVGSEFSYDENQNFDDLCWNDRSCEVFADTVQIQATHHSVEALTSSQVTPQYYQAVCSAIMIALTGANRELIEQQIPQFFNYASQNGRSRWEVLGIEVTVAPDHRGLLGCDFYKPK